MINYRGLSITREPLGSGGVTTDNLFDPNEQVIFDFYEANRGRYRRALDVGANVGVHSILMAQCGWIVRAFEPDSTHYAMLTRNVASHCWWSCVTTERAAVSDRDGEAEFTRVLGNTTSSHLTGSKLPYGALDRVVVPVVDCRPLFSWADFAKIDCEGHEAVLVQTTTAETWRGLDALLEVGSEKNARDICGHLLDVVPMWAQKIGWGRVRSQDDMPTKHQDGSLFVGHNSPWPK